MIGPKKYTNELTPREQEVLDCLMDGLGYKETAAKLSLSYSTIKSYVVSLFDKKEVNTLQQLLVNEYKHLLDSAGIEKKFKQIRQQAYQLMIEEIQKKLNEVTNE